ncbi:MAG: tRNA (adenosine(37)-N6)-dimethylallyltransferase MiaA [Bacteroidota bacterium]|nr:tRNA (adenosine(37)-N6)-dimethylallyltransferase MiaA [Bacteroidota bacterium]
MFNPENDLVVLMGPTASGKTKLAVQWAFENNTEIISADSRQVYRQMNIGTGKDYNDYIINGQQIKVHLIDICEPGDKYFIYQYQKDFSNAFSQLKSMGKIPILCGGTGLYIEAVLKEKKYTSIPVNETLRAKLIDKSMDELLSIFIRYKTEYSQIADINTHKKLIRAIEISEYLLHHDHVPNKLVYPENPILYCLNPDRETRRLRISERLKYRLKNGLIEEVEQLLNSGISAESLMYYGLEYKFVTEFITGVLDRNEMEIRLEFAIHQYAKRQMTWFRKMEKDGWKINWI